jgi:hypothetical protein
MKHKIRLQVFVFYLGFAMGITKNESAPRTSGGNLFIY